jgi:hypothetical protein
VPNITQKQQWKRPGHGEMSNLNDEVRDAILRQLHAVHSNARSPKTAGILPSDLARRLKPHGFKQQQIGGNLDYLVQKGWVKEVREKRTFTTPRGTTQSAERITYKVSDEGIDHLEGASMFKKTAVGSHVNVTNIEGVTVVGDGNVVNTTFAAASRSLEQLKEAATDSKTINDEQKLNVISDIDSLEAQLQRPKPHSGVVKMLWTNIEKLAAAAGLVELAAHTAELIRPLLS